MCITDTQCGHLHEINTRRLREYGNTYYSDLLETSKEAFLSGMFSTTYELTGYLTGVSFF